MFGIDYDKIEKIIHKYFKNTYFDEIECIKVNKDDRVVFQVGTENDIPPASILKEFKDALDDFQTPGCILILPRYGIKVSVVNKDADTVMDIPGLKPKRKTKKGEWSTTIKGKPDKKKKVENNDRRNW